MKGSSDEAERARIDGQGRLVVTVHHAEDGTRTIERADLQQHEVLLSAPYTDEGGDDELDAPGLVVRALFSGA